MSVYYDIPVSIPSSKIGVFGVIDHFYPSFSLSLTEWSYFNLNKLRHCMLKGINSVSVILLDRL